MNEAVLILRGVIEAINLLRLLMRENQGKEVTEAEWVASRERAKAAVADIEKAAQERRAG